MIELTYDKNDKIVNTTWILKISKDTKKHVTADGTKKEYCSYFTTLPQELYTFLEIKENQLYIIEDDLLTLDEGVLERKLVVTNQKPKIPVSYVKVKLTKRGRNKSKKDIIPTTSFTLSKKIFKNLENAKNIKYTLHPKSHDKYRNKKGVITIELLNE